jgi:hypothetical protein
MGLGIGAEYQMFCDGVESYAMEAVERCEESLKQGINETLVPSAP